MRSSRTRRLQSGLRHALEPVADWHGYVARECLGLVEPGNVGGAPESLCGAASSPTSMSMQAEAPMVCMTHRRSGVDSNLYGAFPVKRLFWVVLTVFCSERERPFFVPLPAIRFAERAEGVKGPKR
jgi:hypothetical protein